MALPGLCLNLNHLQEEAAAPWDAGLFPVQDILLYIQTVPGCGSLALA